MSDIVSTYDLMPESADIDIESIVGQVANVLPEGVKLLETKVEPIAFGLKKVVVGVQIDDSIENVSNDLDDALAGIDGVENVECTSSTVL